MDDGQSWGAPVTVYTQAAAYSDTAILDPTPSSFTAPQGDAGQRVGVLFETDESGGTTAVTFVAVTYR